MTRRCRRASAGVLASRASPTILLPSRRSCVDTQQDPPVRAVVLIRKSVPRSARRASASWIAGRTTTAVVIPSNQPRTAAARMTMRTTSKRTTRQTNRPARTADVMCVPNVPSLAGVGRRCGLGLPARDARRCWCLGASVARRPTVALGASRDSRYGSAALTAYAAISRCSDRSVGPRGGRRRRERSALGGCRRVQLRQGRT